MNEPTSAQSQISRARAAGFFWLITFITGAFAMYIGGSFVVNGNAAATAANVLGNEYSFRIGVAGNLVATIFYLLATILVYKLLNPRQQHPLISCSGLQLVRLRGGRRGHALQLRATRAPQRLSLPQRLHDRTTPGPRAYVLQSRDASE